jgi:hypothetical protein
MRSKRLLPACSNGGSGGGGRAQQPG